jgi:hypothetical protein
MVKNLWAVLVLLVGCTFHSFGKIVLPGVFSDNMVLQQNSEVAVWGWAGPSEKVKIVGSWSPLDTIVTKAERDAHC